MARRVRYTPYNLIRRRPILCRLSFQPLTVPGVVDYGSLFSVSRGYPQHRAGYPRVTERYAEI